MAQYGELILLSIKDHHKHLFKCKIFFLTSTFPRTQYLKITYMYLHRYSSWKDRCKTECQHHKAYMVWNPSLYKLTEMEYWHIIESFLILHTGTFDWIFWSLPHRQYYRKEKREKATQFSVTLLLYFCATVRFTFYKAIWSRIDLLWAVLYAGYVWCSDMQKNKLQD